MIIRTDPSDPTPIYRQIALQTAAQIRDGTLARGERLPTAAQLARSLEVNRNTTLQAYRLLRDEGLIDLRRGRGAVVRAAARMADAALAADASLDDVVHLLHRKGLS